MKAGQGRVNVYGTLVHDEWEVAPPGSHKVMKILPECTAPCVQSQDDAPKHEIAFEMLVAVDLKSKCTTSSRTLLYDQFSDYIAQGADKEGGGRGYLR